MKRRVPAILGLLVTLIVVATVVWQARHDDDELLLGIRPAARVESSPIPTTPSHGDTWTNSYGMVFIYVEPGVFLMGSPEEEPGRYEGDDPLYDEMQHEVSIHSGYWLGREEVRKSTFAAFLKDSRYETDAARNKNPGFWNFPIDFTDGEAPVTALSWNDAKAFCAWLGELEGCTYRLPTEAEWEYACRAGSTAAFSTGATLSTDHANIGFAKHDRPGGVRTTGPTVAGTFPPNAWGFLDMHGNVRELCEDLWKPYDHDPGVESAPAAASEEATMRAIRDGVWQETSRHCRCAKRWGGKPEATYLGTGFRIVVKQGD